MALALAALAAVTLAGPAAVSGAERFPGASPEALLARGIAHSTGSDMLLGLEELREAVRLRPRDELARMSLATALLRAGRFAEAEAEFAASVGEGVARSLAAGTLRPEQLPPGTDPEAVMGLATSKHLLGKTRDAERLYRAFAELVGPMSAASGRAYYRLHELALDSGAAWMDAEAELAKALAVDPGVRSARLLPSFPDPAGVPRLEPYSRKIELVASRADSNVTYDSAPLLDLWSAPADTFATSVGLLEGSLALEFLVNGDGFVTELATPGSVPADELAALKEAVGRLRFRPAISSGRPVPAWIRFVGSADARTSAGSEPGTAQDGD